jgi:CRISPR system Cascade subunit CasD
MAKRVLLLRLEGPLQSWGVRSRWDVRDTSPEPTKSGIIGLLGCALGYPMHDPRLENLDRSLRFGVRVENAGALVTDYQTITDYLPTADGRFRVSGATLSGPSSKLAAEGLRPSTVISPRAYLEDAAFLVALEEVESKSTGLAECAEAVQRPRWPLFLGRKACIPTRPIFEYHGEAYDGIEDALRRHVWQWLGAGGNVRHKKPHSDLTAWLEDETGDITRQDSMRINASRTYGFRTVREMFFAPVFEESHAAAPSEVI